MARWRLLQKHYLQVPGTEAEFRETTNTGRQKRLVLPVPMYLDPDNPGDQNYPGEIIVCAVGTGNHLDIEFTGDPTPDMAPLDAEAQRITDEMAPRWKHPIDTLQDGGYGEMLVQRLEAAMIRTPAPAPEASNDGVMAAITALQNQMSELAAENARLRDAATQAAPAAERRI